MICQGITLVPYVWLNPPQSSEAFLHVGLLFLPLPSVHEKFSHRPLIRLPPLHIALDRSTFYAGEVGRPLVDLT